MVVGAGPGGSAASKRCAQNGFKTLLIDKKKLPREKVCSGMVMGMWAHQIIKEEFGDIPKDVLADPFNLSGHKLHFPGIQPQTIEWKTPVAWRKDLDYWMNRKARDSGVELWDGVRCKSVVQAGKNCTITIQKNRELKEIKAKCVIGADGATSIVRRSLFPKLKVRYFGPLRECYQGSLSLERDFFHWFFPKFRQNPRFDVIHKDGFFLIEGSVRGDMRDHINKTLTGFGFDPSDKPLWKDGCVEPMLHGHLLSGSFEPAAGNILLVGDSTGLIFPITFEGIGGALKSGILAAEAAAEGIKDGKEIARIYLGELAPVLDVMGKYYEISKGLDKDKEKGPEELALAIRDAYEEILKIE